jgi:hypothetical protein
MGNDTAEKDDVSLEIAPISIATAATMFPGQPLDVACAGAAFTEKANNGRSKVPELQDFVDPAAREKEVNVYSLMRAWTDTKDADRNKLPLTVKAALIDGATYLAENNPYGMSLHAKAGDPVLEGADGLSQVYKSFHLRDDPQFRRDALIATADTLEAISQIPNVKDIETKWPKMDIPSKIEFLQQVHNIHASIRGYDPVLVSTFSEPRPAAPKQNNGENKNITPTASMAQAGEESIDFNTWVDPENSKAGPVGFVSFAEEINTILHEGSHIYDDQIRRVGDKSDYKMSEISYEHQNDILATRDYSKVIVGSRRGAGYLDSSEVDDETYRSNPTEDHAFYVGDMVGKYFSLSAKARENYIPSLRFEAKKLDDLIDINNKLSQEAVQKPDMTCPSQ